MDYDVLVETFKTLFFLFIFVWRRDGDKQDMAIYLFILTYMK